MLIQKPVNLGGKWLQEMGQIGPKDDPVVFIHGFADILDDCHATTGGMGHFKVQWVTDTYAIADEL